MLESDRTRCLCRGQGHGRVINGRKSSPGNGGILLFEIRRDEMDEVVDDIRLHQDVRDRVLRAQKFCS